jgi:phosphoribosylpyrophosphate synthetase
MVMTDEPEHTPDPESAEAAMNEVLMAEQAASQAIDACEGEARVSLYEAAQRARRIANRTNERIAIIHQRTRQQLKNRLQNAERAARVEERTRDREDPRMGFVSGIANDMAARLTGSNSNEKSQSD